MYQVLFYSSGSKSPVTEFLDSSPPRLRAKILRQLKYVEEFGLNPTIPSLKKITNTPLWELRILGKDNIRIICATLPKKVALVLHIFKKKKRKTPPKELHIALERYQKVLDN